MSSTYHLLCLSHDPAIRIDCDLSFEAVKALDDREHGALAEHQQCDLAAGRYSYPLIEAACFGSQLPGPTACLKRHNRPIWTDRNVLRLVVAATGTLPDDLLKPFRPCWPAERLARLRVELGIADA
jgi:hypothetical protein